jgi:hypothetical protein
LRAFEKVFFELLDEDFRLFLKRIKIASSSYRVYQKGKTCKV